MSMDFTVIQPVRQRFGNQPPAQASRWPENVFSNAPFVGPSKSFPFDCPEADGKQMGILQFETVGLDYEQTGTLFERGQRESTIRVNGVDLPGGIKSGLDFEWWDKQFPSWRTQILIVPEGVLQLHNVLYVEAASREAFGATFYDDFVLDNVVIFYKTAVPVRGEPGIGRLATVE